MMILPMAAVPFIMKVVGLIWVFVALALILIILVQKGRGGGLGGAFGGSGAGSLLGTKTGDFLTWVTIALVVLFLVLAVLMVKFYKPRSSEGLSQPQTTIPAAPQQQVPASVPEGGTGGPQ
jgi:preprotein translocase subunit SecG